VSTVPLFAVTAAILFTLALHALIVARHLLRKLIAINVLGGSIFLMFVTMAYRGDGDPDPVPHAMVLTGIVVTVGAMGLMVALVRRAVVEDREAYLPEDQVHGDPQGDPPANTRDGS
jgi:multicomponent Na+:H+ antiporter subunit C